MFFSFLQRNKIFENVTQVWKTFLGGSAPQPPLNWKIFGTKLILILLDNVFFSTFLRKNFPTNFEWGKIFPQIFDGEYFPPVFRRAKIFPTQFLNSNSMSTFKPVPKSIKNATKVYKIASERPCGAKMVEKFLSELLKFHYYKSS